MMTNPVRKITQGQFSFLPELTDAEISLQIEYGLNRGYAWSIEYTDDPHPRNTYWEMFGMPMFDLKDAAGVLTELRNCRKDRKSTRLNSSHLVISYAVFCLKKKKNKKTDYSLEQQSIA